MPLLAAAAAQVGLQGGGTSRDVSAAAAILDCSTDVAREYLALVRELRTQVIPAMIEGRADRDRATTYDAIGRLVGVFGASMSEHLPSLFAQLRATLVSKKSTTDLLDAAHTCIAAIINKLGYRVMGEIRVLLEPIYETGLRPAAVRSLQSVVNRIPALSPDVNRRLLQKLRQGLKEIAAMSPASMESETESIVSVLHTLGTFSFEARKGAPSYELLLTFARDGVLPLLSSRHHRIREEAALTCARLLVPKQQRRSASAATSTSMRTSKVSQSGLPEGELHAEGNRDSARGNGVAAGADSQSSSLAASLVGTVRGRSPGVGDIVGGSAGGGSLPARDRGSSNSSGTGSSFEPGFAGRSGGSSGGTPQSSTLLSSAAGSGTASQSPQQAHLAVALAAEASFPSSPSPQRSPLVPLDAATDEGAAHSSSSSSGRKGVDNADQAPPATAQSRQRFSPKARSRKHRTMKRALINEVLGLILRLVVSDTRHSLRQAVLRELNNSALDDFLVEPENLAIVLAVLNDNSPEMRTISISMLGRLAPLRPADVVPHLRNLLMELLMDIDSQHVFASKTSPRLGVLVGQSSSTQSAAVQTRQREEEALRLLGHLIAASPETVGDHVRPVVKALLPVLAHGTPLAAGRAMSALGRLALVRGGEMRGDVPHIMPAVLVALGEGASSSTRRLTVQALCDICQGTGYVIHPYTDYPELLPLLVRALESEQSLPHRVKLVELLGVMGAADPHRLRTHHTPAPSGGIPRTTEADIDDVIPVNAGGGTGVGGGADGAVGAVTGMLDTGAGGPRGANGANGTNAGAGTGALGIGTMRHVLINRFDLHDRKGSSEFYAAVAINALARIAHDATLVDLHEHVMRALMVMTRYRTHACLQFLPQIIPALVAIVSTARVDDRAWASYLADIGKFVRLANDAIRPHVNELLELVLALWVDGGQPVPQLLFLLERLATAAGESVRPHLVAILGKMRASLVADIDPARTATLRILRVLPVFGEHLEGYLHLVLPAVVRLFLDTSAATEVRHRVGQRSMRILLALSSVVPLRDRSSLIVNRLVAVLEAEPALRSTALSLLARLVCALGHDYVYMGFAALVNEIVVRLRLSHPEYERVLRCLADGSPFPTYAPDSEDTFVRVGRLPAGAAGHRRTPSGWSLGEEEAAAAMSAEDSVVATSGDGGGADEEATSLQDVVLQINQDSLRAAWSSVNPKGQNQDWRDWLRRFARALLRESTSAALRACSVVAELHPELPDELFHAAFVSCWADLYEDNQEELVEQIERALMDESRASREIKPVLLGLAEVMEFTNKGRLPIPEKILSQVAFQTHAFAKALHYEEREFFYLTQDARTRDDSCAPYGDLAGVEYYTATTPYMSGIEGRRSDAVDTDARLQRCAERLVAISNKLQVSDAVAGLLKRLQRDRVAGLDVQTVRPDWYEKLGKWDEALSAYSSLAAGAGDGPDAASTNGGTSVNPDRISVSSAVLGQMRCLHELGHWRRLSEILDRKWTDFRVNLSSVDLISAAHLGCWAALGTANWAAMPEYLSVVRGGGGSSTVPEVGADALFFHSVISVWHGADARACDLLARCRSHLAMALGRSLKQSYDRGYGHMVRAQLLTELDEILLFRASTPTRRDEIRAMWARRLAGGCASAKLWRQVLGLRSLVLAPAESLALRLKYSKICLEKGWIGESEKTLQSLLSDRSQHALDRAPEIERRVGLAMLRHQWVAQGPNEVTLRNLSAFTQKLEIENLNSRSVAGMSSNSATAATTAAAVGHISLDTSVPYWLAAVPLGSAGRNSEHDGLSVLVEMGDAADGNAAWAANSSTAVVGMRTVPSESAEETVARCHLLLGQWHLAQADSSSQPPTAAIEEFARVTTLRPEWHTAWQSFAFLNYQVATANDTQDSAGEEKAAAIAAAVAGVQASGRRRSVAPVVLDLNRRVAHASRAVQAYFRAIALNSRNCLQDALRLLSLWFTYGWHPDVNAAVAEGRATIALDTWLPLIPQLIARIDTRDQTIQTAIHHLLLDIGKQRPQAVIMPLLVVAKSSVRRRRERARQLLNKMQRYHPLLVRETTLVSSELHRAGALWHEMWHAALQEASKLYYDEDNVDGMLATLEPMHRTLEDPQTLSERAFLQAFQTELSEAHDWVRRYRSTGKRRDLDTAWGTYLLVFKRISAMLPRLARVDLQQVAPRLLSVRDLHMVMPGTALLGSTAGHGSDGGISGASSGKGGVVVGAGGVLGAAGAGGAGLGAGIAGISSEIGAHMGARTGIGHAGVGVGIGVSGVGSASTRAAARDVVRIASFSAQMDVIGSKQRPRICKIIGSNGVTYQYLLKCQEDPRIDERVMAFFGLVNTLLAAQPATSHRRLRIIRYSITPLSPDSGLIGWVPHCDTMHALIRQQRADSRVPLHAEHGAIRKMAPDVRDGSGRPTDNGFYHLTPMQRCEVFVQGVSCTPGDDLANTLWLKSPDSETWLKRRTNYTRSTAVMSMVGHVLGLGDRHPSNIMLHRFSGHAVHIDFGDTFETAQRREQFPERVPFRLTRVMTQAMEVSGIEGTFRVTCESVLGVLRANKDSLLAVLEAFVHDPLLAWHLDAPVEKPSGETSAAGAGTSGAGDAGGEDTVSAAAAAPASVTGPSSADEDMTTLRPEGTRSRRSSSISARLTTPGADDQAEQTLRSRARSIVRRVELKLTGREFGRPVFDHGRGGGKQRNGAVSEPPPLPVAEQVDRLIAEATDPINLASMFTGWCAFW